MKKEYHVKETPYGYAIITRIITIEKKVYKKDITIPLDKLYDLLLLARSYEE